MDRAEQLAAAEAKVEQTGWAYVNSRTAAPEQRQALDAEYRQAIGELHDLRTDSQTD